MRRAVFALALSIAASAPAGAAWEVIEGKDRLTDKVARAVFVNAAAPDGGVTARVDLQCTPLVGTFLTLQFSRPLTRHRLSFRYRIDAGEARPRVMDTVRGAAVAGFAPLPDIARAKRLRVEVFPASGSTLFYEFDLSGFAEARRKLTCD